MKIPKKQAEAMVDALVNSGAFPEDERDEKLQELIDDGLVSSGRKLGAPREEFASEAQELLYNAGKNLIKETRSFWDTNENFKYLQSTKVEVGIADDDGNVTGSARICVEPSLALKNNRVVMASFETNHVEEGETEDEDSE